MKILFVLDSVHHFSYHETVIRALCARGHRVRLLYGEKRRGESSDQAAFQAQGEIPELELGNFIVRRDIFRPIVAAAREMLTYASYQRRTDQSAFYRERWRGYLPWAVRKATRFAVGRAIATNPLAQCCLRGVERLTPSSRAIRQSISQDRPDVVVVSPANLMRCQEVEYLKAAKSLSIPTVVSVLSWDNLTTKGLIHIQPDVLLAWNRTHLHEAAQIHRIPPERIVVTGSPLFDKWFQAPRLLMERAAFCRRVGLSPDQPFIAYLGSSKPIAEDETWLVRELIAALRASPNPAVRRMGVLVRPHPGNAEVHRKLAAEGVPVWPKEGTLPDTEQAVRDFYNTLMHCVAAAGVNTTGMVDAVICHRPCVTVLTEQYSATQSLAVHFTQLLAADVLEVTRSGVECAARIETLMNGQDTRSQLRKKFVLDFVRPRGLDRPAGEIAAAAIELAAGGCTAEQINQRLDAFVAD